MAGGEDESQQVIAACVLSFASGRRRVRGSMARLDPGQALEDGAFLGQRALAPQTIDRAVAGDPRDPGARVVGGAVGRPALECDDERLLNRLLGEIEVAEDADQRRDRPPRLAPEQAVDDSGLILGARDYEAASALRSGCSKPNCV
jgi:hypothetical protein